MKVLHLPTNAASQMSITVRALRDIGIETRGLVRDGSVTRSHDELEEFALDPLDKHPLRGRLQRIRWWRVVLTAIRWADVVHWHGGSHALPGRLGMRYAAFLHKPRLVEFWGTDIRVPELAAADNPFLARLYREDEAAAARAGERARKKQQVFARHGFECLLPGPELASYIPPGLFPCMHAIVPRLIPTEFDPKYPDPRNPRPLVVHMPSHKARKGTDAVLRAVEQLKKDHDFDFRLLHGMPRPEVLAVLRECDIMLDQFILGTHGVALLEAMALGKPALCYIKPSLVSRHPADFPVVNANPDNLAEVLGTLLGDGPRRHELGRLGRAYVEKHHDAHKVARDLIRVYEELIENSKRR